MVTRSPPRSEELSSPIRPFREIYQEELTVIHYTADVQLLLGGRDDAIQQGVGQEGAVSQACVFGLVVIDLGFQIDATYQRLGCGAGRSAKDFERATLVLNEVCRFGVENSAKQCAFLGRNHGREILNAETRKEFSANIQSVSLVGAVGIEPTTSPV